MNDVTDIIHVKQVCYWKIIIDSVRMFYILASKPQEISHIYVEDRTVDVHIGRLRKALNAQGEENLIRTIRGVGYSIDSDSY